MPQVEGIYISPPSSLSHCGLVLAWKSGISVRELISTSKQTKKAQAAYERSSILPKSLQARKKLPPPPCRVNKVLLNTIELNAERVQIEFQVRVMCIGLLDLDGKLNSSQCPSSRDGHVTG